MKFREAFDLWLSHRTIQTHGQRTDASYIAPKTVQDYKICSKALEKFFGSLRLNEIHPGHLMAYQQARAVCDRSCGNWSKPAGANCIRKEIALLIRILQSARVWGEDQEESFIRLRAVENDVPRAMTPEEQHRFLHIASSRADFQFVYWYAILGLQTTGSTKELRTLRLGDIFLRDGFLQIRAGNAKNKYRIRTIPLVSPDVVWALERLIDRARDLGSMAPHHCLFPMQEARLTYDPTRPMTESGLKKRWEKVRNAAGLPWLKPNNLRHTAITRMAEAGTPTQVIMSFAGHVSPRMMQHYVTVSLRAKRGWAETSWAGEVRRAQRGPVDQVPDTTVRMGPQSVSFGGPWPVRTTRGA